MIDPNDEDSFNQKYVPIVSKTIPSRASQPTTVPSSNRPLSPQPNRPVTSSVNLSSKTNLNRPGPSSTMSTTVTQPPKSTPRDRTNTGSDYITMPTKEQIATMKIESKNKTEVKPSEDHYLGMPNPAAIQKLISESNASSSSSSPQNTRPSQYMQIPAVTPPVKTSSNTTSSPKQPAKQVDPESFNQYGEMPQIKMSNHSTSPPENLYANMPQTKSQPSNSTPTAYGAMIPKSENSNNGERNYQYESLSQVKKAMEEENQYGPVFSAPSKHTTQPQEHYGSINNVHAKLKSESDGSIAAVKKEIKAQYNTNSNKGNPSQTVSSSAHTSPTTFDPNIYGNLPVLDNGKFILDGYMAKKGDVGLIKTWKKRYFWLDVKEHKILYYKNKENGDELGCIVLETAYAIHPTPNEKPGSFQINCPNRIWYLRAETVETMQKWMEVLKYHMEMAQAKARRNK